MYKTFLSSRAYSNINNCKKPSCRWSGPTVRPMSLGQRLSLPVAKRKRFPKLTTVPHTLWWRCYIERYNQR